MILATHHRPMGLSRLGAVALVASLATTACSGPGGAEDAEENDSSAILAIGGTSLNFAPTWVAVDGGYFDEQGITVSDAGTSSTAEAIQVLRSGDTDFADVTVSAALDALQNGVDLRIISSTVVANANAVVVSKSWLADTGTTEADSVEDKLAALRGARIGVIGPGSGSNSFARYLLRLAELDPERDAQLVVLQATANMPPALRAGQVDAYVTTSPAGEVSVDAGDAQILLRGVDLPAVQDQLLIATVTLQETIGQRAEFVQRFVSALNAAREALAENPEEVEPLIRERFASLSEEIWDLAWDNNLPTYATSSLVREEQYEANFAVAEIAGDELNEVPYADVVNNTFAEEAANGG